MCFFVLQGRAGGRTGVMATRPRGRAPCDVGTGEYLAALRSWRKQRPGSGLEDIVGPVLVKAAMFYGLKQAVLMLLCSCNASWPASGLPTRL